MRRNILCFVFLLTVAFGFSQNLPIDPKSKKVAFIKIADASGMTAQQIYDVAKEWGNEQSFVIEEDVAGKKVVFKASCKVKYPATKSAEKLDGTVSFKFQIGAKEGKYRYVAIDFTHSGAPEDGGALEDREPDCKFTNISARSWTVIKQQTHKEVNIILDSLTKKMTAVQNDPTKSDDW